MDFRKRVVICITTALYLFVTLGIVSVEASSIVNDINSTETLNDYSEDTSYSVLRGNNLNFGTTQITKLASNQVNMYGLTQCHHVCDNVYLYLYLEQKKNGSYSTYKYWEFTSSNASKLIKSIDVVVPSGYYYRVRGYHAAKDGSKESTTTLTQGVLVS